MCARYAKHVSLCMSTIDDDSYMCIYKYLCLIDELPRPDGSLSLILPPKTISEIKSQIRKAIASSEGKKRGEYTKHSDEDKAIIRKYASEHGDEWR